MELVCPNCGNRLVSHRTDRQTVGQREVVLQWNICQRCRHVALREWSFEDGARPDTRPADEPSQSRNRAAYLRPMRLSSGA